MSAESVRIGIGPLEEYCKSVFSHLGFSEDYVDAVSSGIMEAHLRGAHGQGVGRLPIYVKRIELGLINKDPQISVVSESGATAVLDGDHGLGHYAGTKGMRLAIKKAREFGVGAVGVRNSAHFGVAANYGKLAAEDGLIGIAITNSTALIAAPGGAERLMGNNPICIAVPTRDKRNVVLDMACSNVAFSKIQRAAQTGQSIPPGWGTDKDGIETTDPQAVLGGGMLTAAGGYKGYGLAVMFDILAGVLTGSAYVTNVTHLYQDLENKQRTGHFFIALNLESFMGKDMFYDRLEDFTSLIRNSKKAAGTEKIMLPGEPEELNAKDMEANGVPLPGKVVEQLNDIAARFDIAAFG